MNDTVAILLVIAACLGVGVLLAKVLGAADRPAAVAERSDPDPDIDEEEPSHDA